MNQLIRIILYKTYFRNFQCKVQIKLFSLFFSQLFFTFLHLFNSVILFSSSLNIPLSSSKPSSSFLSSPIPAFSRTPKTLFAESKSHFYPKRNDNGFSIRAQTLDFSDSFFEGGFGSEDDPSSPGGPGFTAVEEKEEPQCPPGLRQYETMMVLRPDMSEDERLALTQKYEEVIFSNTFNFLFSYIT